LVWTEKSLAWFDRAAARTSFYQQIVQQCSGLLAPETRVFDLGCGAGFLSMALAPAVQRVAAVDINPRAIAFLREKCQEKNLSNVTCQVADWHRWEPEQPADVVFLCYCDGLFSQMEKLRTLVKKYLVVVLPVIKNNFHLEEFYPLPTQHPNRETIPRVKAFLEKEQISFQIMPLSCEFGQPFSSIGEYEEFLHFYYRIPRTSIPPAYTAQYLHPSNGGYYLSNFKESGILIMKSDDLHKGTWVG